MNQEKTGSDRFSMVFESMRGSPMLLRCIGESPILILLPLSPFRCGDEDDRLVTVN
jgi:hypothetical protein